MADMSTRGRRNAQDSLYSRRDSVAIAGSNFQAILHDKLVVLRTIWNNVGMSEEQRKDRMSTAFLHLENLLNEMVEEEELMLAHMRQNVGVFQEEIDALAKEMRVPRQDFLNETGELSLMALESRLSARREELMKERDRRIAEREELMAEDRVFAQRLDVASYYLDLSQIPQLSDLESLRIRIEQNKAQFNAHRQLLMEKRPILITLARKLNISKGELSDFQRQLLIPDYDDNDLVLSYENMHQLDTLSENLHIQYEQFLVRLREKIDVVRNELHYWWDMCHVPEPERERFAVSDPEIDCELAIKEYQTAIDFWRTYYEARKMVLDKIAEWKTLWQKLVDFEQRERDFNRYNNRGGALLQEEKERKRVQAQLPKVQKALADLVANYDNANPNEPFTIDGVRVMEHISAIEAEYGERKKREKLEKEAMKREQLAVERIYGASAAPTTPQKRRLAGPTGCTTPSRLAVVSSAKKLASETKSQSKVFVHSSIAALVRSPLKPTLASKPPRDVPSRVNSLKRKAAPSAELHAEVENLLAHESAGSYNEFVKMIQNKGAEHQSSFVTGIAPAKAPRKV